MSSYSIPFARIVVIISLASMLLVGCKNDSPNSPAATPVPQAYFRAEMSPDDPLTYIFSVNSPDNNSTYSWDLGDESDLDQGASVTHTYSSAGGYDVTLTIVRDGGMVESEQIIDSTIHLIVSASFSGDECNNPIVVTAGANPIDTSGMTTGTDIIDNTLCPDPFDELGNFHQDAWYSFTPSVTGAMEVSTCNNADFDTDLAVYSGCAALENSLIACNGDGGAGCNLASRVNVDVTAGAEYLIRVGGWDDSNFGTASLDIEVWPAPVADIVASSEVGNVPHVVNFNSASSTGPITEYQWDFGNGSSSILEDPQTIYTSAGNYNVSLVVTGPGGKSTATTTIQVEWLGDECSNPIPVIDGNNTPYEWGGNSAEINTAEMTTSDDPPSSTFCQGTGLGDFHQDAWYSFTPSIDGLMSVFTCNASFDTDLAVYQGDCHSLQNSLIACNGDEETNCSCNGNGDTGCNGSQLSVSVTAGIEYLIRVGGSEDTDSGTGNLGIVVATPPEAAFVYTADLGPLNAPLEVVFNASYSTGVINSYQWDFGDGESATGVSPTHTYTLPGDYEVTLVVTGDGGEDTATIIIPVLLQGDECDNPIPAQLGANPIDTIRMTASDDPPDDAICLGSALGDFHHDAWYSFTPSSTGTMVVSTCNSVDFDTDLAVYNSSACTSLTSSLIACNGDGETECNSTSLYDSHLSVGVTAGTEYLIRVGGWGAGHFGTGTLQISVGVPPEAEIASSSEGFNAPLAVTFYGSSSAGSVDSYLWDFGDGEGATGASPTHTYDLPGAYVVTLVVTGPGGQSSTTTTFTVTLQGDEWCNPIPADIGSTDIDTTLMTTGDIDVSDDLCPNTLLGGFYQDAWYSFTPDSTGAVVVSTCNSVNFDTDLAVYQGACNSLDIPMITCDGSIGCGFPFASRVVMDVTANTEYLIRVGGWGIDDAGTGTLEISEVESPVADFVAVDLGAGNEPPMTWNFTSTSTGEITSYLWNFGDGEGATGASPPHTYALPGAYVVTLVVTGPGGQSSATTTISVTLQGDDCGNPLPANIGSTDIDTTVMTTGDIDVSDDLCPNTMLGGFYQDAWYSFTPDFSGTVVVSTCNSVNFDTDLAVYQGACNSLDIPMITCDGSIGCGFPFASSVVVSVVAGTEYLIRVGGWGIDDAGTGTLEISNVCPAGGNFEVSGLGYGNSSSRDVALGDLDGDGDLDAWVANTLGEVNKVMFNQGGYQGGVAGNFADSNQFLGNSRSHAVALGDLDGDGDLDAWVANDSADANRVWINQGGDQGGVAGDFADNSQALGNSNSRGVALGDLDGDGDLDAWVANDSGQPNRVWMNQGGLQEGGGGVVVEECSTPGVPISINLDPAVDVLESAAGSLLAVGVDISHTYVGDIVLTLESPAGTVVTLHDRVGGTNNNINVTYFDGGAPNAAPYDIDGNTMQPSGPGTLADFNINCAGSWTMTVADLANFDDGTLNSWCLIIGTVPGVAGDFLPCQTLGDSESRDVALGDLDGDGDLDAWVANYNQPNRVWINQGGEQGGVAGNFADSGQALGQYGSRGVSLGDVDGDGDLDAWVANKVTDGNRVWINDGFGFFEDSEQALGNSSSLRVSLGDLDGDGDLDAWVANHSFTGDRANHVWINDGFGIFQDSGQALGASDSYGAALGDLDGDGDLDAWVANYSQPNRVWINNCDPSVPPPFNPDPITLVTWEGTYSIANIDDCSGVNPPNNDIELTFTQTGIGEGLITGTSSDTDVIGTWIATGVPDEYSVAMDLYYGGDLAIEYSTEVVDVGDDGINQCFEGTFVNDVLGQTDGLVCEFCIELVAN